MSKKVAAGALILSALSSRAMFSIRAPHKTHSLTWGLWGGMQDPAETIEECLYREVKEEMGFLPEFKRTRLFNIYNSADGNFAYHTYVCIVEKEFAPWIGHETAGYCWMDLGIWPKPMHYGAKKTLCTAASLKQIKQILSTQ